MFRAINYQGRFQVCVRHTGMPWTPSQPALALVLQAVGDTDKAEGILHRESADFPAVSNKRHRAHTRPYPHPTPTPTSSSSWCARMLRLQHLTHTRL